MRKRIIPSVQKDTSPPGEDWLDLERLAQVEITSEDAAHPIESALLPGQSMGWRAANPGEQTIRLLFAHPQRLRRRGANCPPRLNGLARVVFRNELPVDVFRQVGNLRI